MSFVTALALAIGLLVAAPVAAHLLRRRRAGEVVLPTARLLSTTPPTARRRTALEDRALLGVRALAIVALAILGATPFVSCSKLSLSRKDGASIAMVLVLDDSLSMNAPSSGGQSRFSRAKAGALDLLSEIEPGDSVAVVLAGSEARVHLSTTSDLATMRKAIEELEPSDRATDLETAIGLARDLLRLAPQTDKRIVVLSDLADGKPADPAIDIEGGASLWFALPDLAARGEADCAVLSAERLGDRIDVQLRCTEGATAAGRKVGILSGRDEIASETVPEGAEALVLKVPEGSSGALDARLSPGDAIAADDASPVVEHASDFALAVVSDAASMHVETGGPPPVERALAALELGPFVKPRPSVPEHEEELATKAGLVLDDPPGLTPEERRSVARWVSGGGTLLLALGRRSASAPLGAGFGELVPGVVRWRTDAPPGAAHDRCTFFGPSAPSLAELAPKGRAVLDHEALQGGDVLCAFTDGAPLLLRRTLGRGSILITTLPFDLDSSDFPLRPAFLVLLDAFVESARARGGARQVEAGGTFAFHGFEKVAVDYRPIGGGEPKKLEVTTKDGVPRVVAPRIGRYEASLDGATDLRFAIVPEREIDLRPRAVSPRAADPSLGGETRKLDASPWVAFALLALLVMEIGLRIWSQRSAPRPS